MQIAKSALDTVPGEAIATDGQRVTILTPDQTARLTGLSKPTLQRQRSTGDGIPFIKLGPRRVAYRLSDIESWLAGRVVISTSDARQRGLS